MSWIVKARDAALFTSHVFHGLSGFFAGVAEILNTDPFVGLDPPKRDTMPSPATDAAEEVAFQGLSDEALNMVARPPITRPDQSFGEPLIGSLAARRRSL